MSSAAQVTPDYVADLMRDNKIVYFSVKTMDKNMTYAQQNDALSQTEAISYFYKIIKSIKGRNVIVNLRPKSGKEANRGGDMHTGYYELVVDISENLPASERNGGNFYQQHQGANIGAIEQILERENKIKALELAAQRRELEATASSPWVKIAEKFAENDKLINAIGDRLLTALIPAPKHAQTIAAAQPIEPNEQIKQTLGRLQKLDADYINTLQYLAAYLEQNPGMIDTVKSMITPTT